MSLPVPPTIEPMEARQVDALPEGDAWVFEPKWDGFRCVAFRDGDAVELRSKAGKPLGRYFPDVVDALGALEADRFVLDGELVVPVAGRLSFDDLLLRVHPAASRVRKLAREHPALYIAFDLLVDENGRSLLDAPLAQRRATLEGFAARFLAGDGAIRLSPETSDRAAAARWLRGGRSGLDGVMAKRAGLPYLAGSREGMVKVKNLRTADCVVGGFRYATRGRVVGSLLLGLYDDEGLLHHVGFTSGLRAAERKRLTTELEPLIEPPGFTGNKPGGPSRWSTERSTAWEPLRPERVVEVRYDHFTGGRFRHGTGLVRWRPDKAPRQCTFEQVGTEGTSSLRLLSSVPHP